MMKIYAPVPPSDMSGQNSSDTFCNMSEDLVYLFIIYVNYSVVLVD